MAEAPDPRIIWQEIGEPPESPWAYANRTGIDEAEVPQEVKQAWRTWNQKEQEFVERYAERSGESDPNKILEQLGYKNEADKGRSMFARYGGGGEKKGVLEAKSKDAFQLAVHRGHFTFDQKTGKYYNVGRGDPNDPKTWQWVDEGGKAINPPMGGSSQGFGTGWSYGNSQSMFGGGVGNPQYGGVSNPYGQTAHAATGGRMGTPPGHLPPVDNAQGIRDRVKMQAQQQQTQQMDESSPYNRLTNRIKTQAQGKKPPMAPPPPPSMPNTTPPKQQEGF